MIEYYAYGSNMNSLHLQDWLRRFGVEPEGVSKQRLAVLPDYRFRTNYVTTSGLGAANIEPRPGDAVEGILLSISPNVQEILRCKEGFPHRYDETYVEVILPSNDGTVLALTYRVTPEHRLPDDVPVSPRYRDFVLTGAQEAGLSREYQEHLRRVLKTAPEMPMPSLDDTATGTCLLGRSRGDSSVLG